MDSHRALFAKKMGSKTEAKKEMARSVGCWPDFFLCFPIALLLGALLSPRGLGALGDTGFGNKCRYAALCLDLWTHVLFVVDFFPVSTDASGDGLGAQKCTSY